MSIVDIYHYDLAIWHMWYDIIEGQIGYEGIKAMRVINWQSRTGSELVTARNNYAYRIDCGWATGIADAHRCELILRLTEIKREVWRRIKANI